MKLICSIGIDLPRSVDRNETVPFHHDDRHTSREATVTPTETGTRPRVEGERELEILEATLEVLDEVGYDLLTMDAVATRAKASKATLYRRWKGKPELVVAAIMAHKGEPVGPGHRHPARRPARGVLRRSRRAQRPAGAVGALGRRHRDGPRPGVRRGLPARLHRPEGRVLARHLRAGPRARRGAPRRRPLGPRAGPRRDRPAPRLPARRHRHPRAHRPACSTRSSSRRRSTAPAPAPDTHSQVRPTVGPL